MRKLRAVSMIGVWMTAGLTGCFSTTRAVQRTQAPDTYKTANVEQLEQEVAARDAELKALDAQVMITASTGGAKEGQVTEYTSLRGYIFVRKPEELRVILQVPILGSKALDMVSDGKTFTLMHASTHGDVWMQGTNTVKTPSKNGLENLRPPVFLDSLLVPKPGAQNYVTLTESTRVVTPESKHHAAVEEPDYDLAILRKKDASGNVLLQERVVHISRVTMLPFQQDIYDEAGRLVTQATYENYQPVAQSMGGVAGQVFPMLITIKRPLEEYSLKIEVTKLTVNETFDSDQFELKAPAGVTVQQMQ